MKEDAVDLSNMTVEDLFQAKDERRKGLAKLPFEEKIDIVKKLQSVARSLQPTRERRRQRLKPQQNSDKS